MSLMRHIVVQGLSSEVAGLSESNFTEKVQRSVNGRQSDVGVLFGQQAIHLLRRDVFHLEEHAQNMLALTRKFELMLRQVLFEQAHFFQIFAHPALRKMRVLY